MQRLMVYRFTHTPTIETLRHFQRFSVQARTIYNVLTMLVWLAGLVDRQCNDA